MTGKHIMVIDDDPDDQEFIDQALKEITASVHCVFASNCLEAIDLIARNRSSIPDYIFLDLNMPIIDGTQCLKRLKQTDALKNIPVFICTTSRNEREREKIIRLGAVDYFTKPSRLSDWAPELRRMFIAHRSKD